MYFIQIRNAMTKGVIVMSMENRCVSHPINHGQRKTASNIVDFVDTVYKYKTLKRF